MYKRQLEDYMLDELVIEADVKDCTPPAFMLAAATSMDQLTSELDIPDLSGQMSQLEDATAQLQSLSLIHIFLCLFFFYILLINATRTHFEIQRGFSLLPGRSLLTNLKSCLLYTSRCV